MALNIRRQQTLDAAKQLSQITGEPMVTEIELAVIERLQRLESQQHARAERVARIAREISTSLPEDFFDGDPTRHLYDAAGLPK